MTVVLTDAAADDIERIAKYLAAHNPSGARVTLERLRGAIALLRQFPSSGRAGQYPGTRELVVSATHYILVYEGSETVLRVLRVWDGRQGGRPIEDATG